LRKRRQHRFVQTSVRPGVSSPSAPVVRTNTVPSRSSGPTRGPASPKLVQLLQRALDSYRRGEWTEAEQLCRVALGMDGTDFDALHLCGVVVAQAGRPEDARELLLRAADANPGIADVHNSLGNVLFELGRYQEALASYDRALSLQPCHAKAHKNRGVALQVLHRHAEALESYDRALQIEPDYPYVPGSRLYSQLGLCAWHGLDDIVARLEHQIRRGEPAVDPFVALALPFSRATQRKAAQIWIERELGSRRPLPGLSRYSRRERIRVGYFSFDFRNHPAAHLLAELFERHDRSKFEVSGFSLGPDTDDPVRKRIAAAFDRFIDVRLLSDVEVVRRAQELEIDIAVDLNGITHGARPGIFAARAAPVQVSYLGYLGTMAADFIDYLVADATLVPEAHRSDYTEKIVYLPWFQANAATKLIADRVFTREELGLPPTGFVFCCFNSNYKIVPRTFDSWMAILGRVEGSVLLLNAENDAVVANLRREAAARGVDPRRLVFAARLPMPEYLARYRAADLFLDTAPYNAGATASDALWVGLPVLTCLGETFAGRMGASLLTAIGMPELVTRTPEEYEHRAVELATHPTNLQHYKETLARNRDTARLFDSRRFAAHIEAAYARIHERCRAGLPPDHVFVPPAPQAGAA